MRTKLPEFAECRSYDRPGYDSIGFFLIELKARGRHPCLSGVGACLGWGHKVEDNEACEPEYVSESGGTILSIR
jgi:hypothetical protein